jgi:dTDP-4-dehydrorhamnose reductase
MKKILVTGANGQLGSCLKDASQKFPKIEFIFVDREVLDISNVLSVNTFFEENDFDFCINAAAYTNVEKAESDKELAFLVNAEGVKNISLACKKHDVTMLHISTDYVFDGKKLTPYTETDITNPINVYGASKLKGEEYIKEICDKYFIIRTSWLYSQYGHNFLKSILKFSKKKDTLTITTEQTGTPTNANDLADILLQIVRLDLKEYGIYHYSNDGEATWHDFAKAIITFSGLSNKVNVVETDYYPTFAKRPAYSILNKNKISALFQIKIDHWQLSLKKLLENNKI